MTLFGRRVPLWVTPLPLAAAIAVYSIWWDGKRDALRDELANALPGAAVTTRGFPYRLQADLGATALRRDRPASFLEARAAEVEIDRQPWNPRLTIVAAREPRLQVAAPVLAGARLDIEGAFARASLNTRGERLARLSLNVDAARVWLAALPVRAEAARFELHVRETPALAGPGAAAAAGPRQAQVVARATALRLGGGDPLTMLASFDVRAAAPLAGVRAWAAGGTVELERLTLADATGTVATVRATVAPRGDGRLMVAGTVTTLCPRSVLAALAGRRGAPEYRARREVVIAFSGLAGAVRAATGEAELGVVPVRRQLPPCPRLRG